MAAEGREFMCTMIGLRCSEDEDTEADVDCPSSDTLSRSAVIFSAWAARAAEYMSRCWYRRRRKRSANSETIRSMSGSADMRRSVRRRLEVSAARVLSERRVF